MPETTLKDVITAYRNLSFCDRTAFYYTVSNDVDVSENNLQDFLIKTRMKEGVACIYCEGGHVVRNGHRPDGTQRFICRDCKRSFIPTSHSITSRTRKRLTVWAAYIRCMMDAKTLGETSEECGISVTTAFAWRHKILDSLHELTDKVYLTGTVEADETFFNADTDCRIRTDHQKTYGIQRINAYHRTLKDFLRGFHGVSTKHLGSYLVWNEVIRNKRRSRENTIAQLFSQILCTSMSVPNRSISARAALLFA